jgi:hypothetical protein
MDLALTISVFLSSGPYYEAIPFIYVGSLGYSLRPVAFILCISCQYNNVLIIIFDVLGSGSAYS